MVEVCDVVTINAPLHPETENLFDAEMLARMKRGSYLINTARGKICDRDAVARACESGQLAGYAGDVWFPQPAPRDHPWRSMPHHGMTPHTSGTSLSAQARYAAGRARDPRVLVRRAADPRGVPDRRRRHARRRRRPLLQRGRRHGRLRGGRPLQERLIRGRVGRAMKMRAAVLEEFGEPLAVQEVELAEPRAGEVLVRLVACGVCHTDLYTASGADPSGYAPTVLGHEGAGVVEQVGAGRHLARARATTSSPSSRPSAASASTASTRGPTSAWRSASSRTRASSPTAPPASPATATAIRHFMGCSTFAEYTVMPEIALAKVDPEAPFEHACLFACGLSTGLGAAINTAAVRAGQHLRRLRRRHGRARRGRRLPPAGRRADRLRRPLAGAARAGPRPGRDRPDRGRRGRGRARSSR